MVNFAFATEGSEKESTTQPVEQQGEKKQITDDIDPGEGLEGGTEPTEDETQVQQSVDSTEDESVNKYNFIFYFLYKLKYNENQEVQEMF